MVPKMGCFPVQAGCIPMLLYLFSFGHLKFVTPDGRQPGVELIAFGFVLNIIPVLALAIYILRIKRFRRKKKVTPVSAATSTQKFEIEPSSSNMLNTSEAVSRSVLERRFYERRKSITVADEHELGIAIL